MDSPRQILLRQKVNRTQSEPLPQQVPIELSKLFLLVRLVLFSTGVITLKLIKLIIRLHHPYNAGKISKNDSGLQIPLLQKFSVWSTKADHSRSERTWILALELPPHLCNDRAWSCSHLHQYGSCHFYWHDRRLHEHFLPRTSCWIMPFSSISL